MRSKGKFKKWIDAGLITQDQFEAICEFEKGKNAGTFGRGMVGLGLFAIVIGILSMIAANWMAIPGSVKIAAHFMLSIAAGYAVIHFNEKKQYRIQDAALMVFFGLNLTMIALIGQVFQIEGNLANALLLWMVISSPVIFYYAKSYITALIWSIAMLVTLGAVAGEYLFDKHEFAFLAYTFTLSLYIPLSLLALGHLNVFEKWRSNFAGMFRALGAGLLVLMASTYTQVWYVDWHDAFGDIVQRSDMQFSSAYTILLVIFLSAIGGLVVYGQIFKSLSKENGAASLLFIGVSCLFIGLPVLLPTGGSSIVPMVLFLGYWAFVAWHGHRVGSNGLMSLAIYVLAIRIFIIYAEAMGGLMMTGFGLISGGVTMIAMVWAARKLNKHLSDDMKGAA